jgi:acyl dehydratase
VGAVEEDPCEVVIAKIADFHLGQHVTFTKTFTDDDVQRFIAITGDSNPLHVDDAFAAATRFGRRVVHGMLTASILSTMVGMLLPGRGAIYRSQTLRFLRPVHVGDTVTAHFVVRAIDVAKHRLTIESWIENEAGERVLEGECEAGLLAQPAVLDLHVEALIAASEGDLDRCAASFAAAREWESANGYARGALQTSHQSALTTNFGGDLARLSRYYLETLKTLKKMRNHEGLALCLRSSGEVALVRGNRDEAAKAWSLSVRLFQEIGLREAEQVAVWLAALGHS